MRILFSSLFLVGLISLTLTRVSVSADDFKPEAGFSLLFSGQDLSGWKTKKGESLEKKTEALGGRFKAVGGNLVIDDAVKGDVVIETAKELSGDVHIKFDFLPGKGCNNDLFFHGVKFDIKPGDVKNLKEGQWHEFEIISQGEKVEFKCNGEMQRLAESKAKSSPLGLRAEFGPIQYRKMRFKQSPK